MKHFKKLTISSLVLSVLSVGAYAETTFKTDTETVSANEIIITSGNEDSTRVTLRSDNKTAYLEIEASTPPLRYTTKNIGEYLRQDQFNATDDVVLIGSKGVTSAGVTIHNVAGGQLDKDSKQAVNGAQLFEVKKDLAETEDQRKTMAINLNGNNVKIGNLEEQAQKHKGQLTQLEKRAGEADSKFEEVRRGFETVSNTFAANDKAIKEGFTRVGEAIRENEEKTQQGFARVGEVIQANEEKNEQGFAAVGKRLEATDKKVEVVTKAFDGLNKAQQEAQKENGEKFVALDKRVGAANVELGKISASLNKQLENATGRIGALANQVQHHDTQLKSLDKKVSQVDRKAQQGIAAALAVAAIPQAVLPNENVIAFAAGNWRSANGMAIGFSHASGNGKWLFKVGAVNAGNNYGANAGIGYRW